MRVGAWQFDVSKPDASSLDVARAVERNTETVERGLRAAQDSSLRLVLLPEMWPTSFAVGAGPFGDAARFAELLTASDAAVARIAALSAELGIAVAGSAFAAHPSGRPTNRLTVFDRGSLVFSYDKLHLFTPTAEPLAFTPGERAPTTFELDGVTATGVICYDLRFGPLLDRVKQSGAELLLVPAQWPTPRVAHWRALLAGRAAELQGFVLGCNRTGSEPIGRRGTELEFPGASGLAGPDGQWLEVAERGADSEAGAGLIWAELEVDAARSLRREIPVSRDRRNDFYRDWLA